MCEAMEWSVLPVAGGLYDQHPELLSQWEVILRAKSEEFKREQSKRDAQMGHPKK